MLRVGHNLDGLTMRIRDGTHTPPSRTHTHAGTSTGKQRRLLWGVALLLAAHRPFKAN